MGQPRMELQVIGEDSCHAAGSTEPAPQMLALRRLAGMELSLAGKPPGALLEYLTQLAVNTEAAVQETWIELWGLGSYQPHALKTIVSARLGSRSLSPLASHAQRAFPLGVCAHCVLGEGATPAPSSGFPCVPCPSPGFALSFHCSLSWLCLHLCPESVTWNH